MSYIGAEPSTAAFPFDQFSGTGAATSFTLTYAPAGTTSILVAISGVTQNPNLYSVIGTTLTFSPAPPAGTNNISVLYLGLPVIGSSSPGNTAFLSSTDLTATAGQTVFASAGSYTPGFVQVYRNGARLGNADFTATNGTTITLANAAAAGDLVTIEYYTLTSLVNALPLTGGTVTGSTTFNTGVNLAAVSGNVGIGTSSPSGKLDVKTGTDSKLTFNDGSTTGNVRMEAVNAAYSAYKPLELNGSVQLFATGGTERMRIDSSGNVGVQVSANLTAKLNFPNSDYGEAINYYSNASETGRSGVGKYANETRHYVATSDFFGWRTGGPSGTERMRLNSSGTLLLGTATTGFVNTNYGWQLNRDAESFLIGNTPTSLLTINRNNDGDIFKFFRNGGQQGWISVSTTGTTFGTLSDRRAKQNFAASASVLDRISQAQVQSFDWKAGGHTEYGFVAQDLHTVFPFAVTVGDDNEQVEKPWGLDNSKLVPVLVKAIQEQQTLITALTARITALESK